jgi:hypothetical protein
MSDPLQGIVHSEEQPSFSELREQFREENRQRIHRRLREDEIVIRAKDGTVVARKKTGYLTDAPPGHEHQRVDDWMAAGGRVPEFSKEFCIERDSQGNLISDLRGLEKELRDLDRDATALAESERVSHAGVESAPALASLDDESVVKYLDQQKEQKESNAPEKCSDINDGTYAGIRRDGASPGFFSSNVSEASGTLTPEVLDEFAKRTKGD